jgi:hypothetical protein
MSTPTQHRKDEAARFAAQLGLDGDELFAGAMAAWSNLNPQTVTFTRALSVAGAVLVGARDGDTPAPRCGPAFKVGDGATEHLGTDAFAYTVTAVSASGKTITMRADKATLDPAFKPDFTPGGFCGHVSNQHDQRYTYEPDPNGAIRKARLTARGWRVLGAHLPVTAGRHAFHDYNF